jgi:PKD repeat protein
MQSTYLDVIFDPRGSSAAPGFSIAKETFDFGDGNHETFLPSGGPGSGLPIHRYLSYGKYTVKLTVIDSGGEISPP